MRPHHFLLRVVLNPFFKVTIDLGHPRPHFLILPREGVHIANDLSRITSEQTQQLLKAALSILESFDEIDGGILSVRRGRWRRKRKERKDLQVNFCVQVDSFMRIFKSLEKDIPDWPGERYVTKHWKSNNPSSYEENVRGYPYDGCILNALAAIEEEPFPESSGAETPLEGGITKIVFHSSHPKIGFVGRKPVSIQELHQVLSVMENFAEKRHLTTLEFRDPEALKHGCHICLYLGSVPTDAGWNFNKEDGEDVVGYIVTSGYRFYYLCPEELRKNWLEAYKQQEFQCLT